jgi:hypothetical protein
MHYYMVLFLGLAAGLDPQVARTIVLASQYVDDNAQTRPVDHDKDGDVDIIKSATSNQEGLKLYHFMLDKGDKKHIHTGGQLRTLEQASGKVKVLCSLYTFNHLGWPALINKINPSGQPNEFDGINWSTNEERTLKVQHDIFNQLSRKADLLAISPATFDSIKEALAAFNKIGESEKYTFSLDENGKQVRKSIAAPSIKVYILSIPISNKN